MTIPQDRDSAELMRELSEENIILREENKLLRKLYERTRQELYRRSNITPPRMSATLQNTFKFKINDRDKVPSGSLDRNPQVKEESCFTTPWAKKSRVDTPKKLEDPFKSPRRIPTPSKLRSPIGPPRRVPPFPRSNSD